MLDWVFAYPPPTRDSPFRLTPLSILYPGALIESRGYSVAYWDARWDSPDELLERIKDADNIGVSAFTGYQCGEAAEILQAAKLIKPNIITHLGGHHARLCTEAVKREPFIDEIWPNRSYGENLFPFSSAAQQIWKRGDWQFMTSSGCPYGCQFCALRSGWTMKPLDELERQIDALYDLAGFTEVSFYDPNIGFGRWRDGDGKRQTVDRVERIRGIGKILRKHGIRWDGNIRSDYITPELVDAMAWSGCYSIEFGCESGNDWFLRNVIKKGHGVDSILNANRLMANSGISVMNSFIRGSPRETHAQWLDTMDVIDEVMILNPQARASVYRFTPYPGSPFYDMAVRGDGIAKFDPPKTMAEWGTRPLMADPTYWCAGMCFRLDNTRKNFQGKDWEIIAPYVDLARHLWKVRRPEDFPADDVERLIQAQIEKQRLAA